MEIKLVKTKLTASILNQMQPPSIEEFMGADCLGYVILKGYKYLLLEVNGNEYRKIRDGWYTHKNTTKVYRSLPKNYTAQWDLKSEQNVRDFMETYAFFVKSAIQIYY